MFSRTATIKSTGAYCDKILRLKQELSTADAVLIGAEPGFPPLPDLLIRGNALKITLRILSESMAFVICIPAASTRLTH